jgi:hypothetical protein
MNWIWTFLFNRGEILRDLIFLAAVIFACFVPRFANRPFTAIERLGSRLARRRMTAIVAIATAAIAIRVSVLWLFPVPYPQIHDEFSYLLQADTFAHGRLTNPTHPMWVFFDTFHVNQQPTYESKYPPGQGMALALGQRLGHPWIGVLLTGGIMCGAVLWMLQGWFPPGWALLGSVLVMFKVAVFSYWMNSYLGGFVAAIGGALVLGALPRITHALRAAASDDARQRINSRMISNAVVMGVGTIILANSRPFEGAFFCLPVFAVLTWRLVREKSSWQFARALAPLCIVVMLGGVFMGYYNWRGTGKATVFPYTVNEKTYMNTPTFVWQKVRPALHYANPQFEEFYNGNMRRAWTMGGVTSVPKGLRKVEYIFLVSLFFFVWPQLSVCLLTLWRILRDRRMHLLLLQAGLVFVSLLLARAWFNLHYIAALVATIFALLTQAMRHVRRWEAWGRPVGIGITRVVVVSLALFAPFNNDHKTRFDNYEPIEMRARFAEQLQAAPGKQLVMVRYSPQHVAAREWVYNGAEIDESKVVWAREIPGTDMQPLLDYFRGRQLWIAEPDTKPPRLSRYDAVANGAGKLRADVTP